MNARVVAQLLRLGNIVLIGAASVLRLPKCPETRCRNHTADGVSWSESVSSAHEFYDYADEHFGWAETAKTERERAIFMQMAAAWLEVAQQWEAAKGARSPLSPMSDAIAVAQSMKAKLRVLVLTPSFLS
jgi:hypothetical protein